MWRSITAAACMAAALAAPAGAQGPGDYIPKEAMAQYHLCRAAVFYHLDDPRPGESRVPPSVARTINDMMTFVAMETIGNKPVPDLDAAAEIVGFTERFYLDFSKALREHRETLLDVARRDKILHDCVSVAWVASRSYIEHLLKWREKAQDAPPLPDPASEVERSHKALESLLGRPPG